MHKRCPICLNKIYSSYSTKKFCSPECAKNDRKLKKVYARELREYDRILDKYNNLPFQVFEDEVMFRRKVEKLATVK